MKKKTDKEIIEITNRYGVQETHDLAEALIIAGRDQLLLTSKEGDETDLIIYIADQMLEAVEECREENIIA
jgi:hypothetical protein